MRTVPIHLLRRDLSTFVQDAASGETIIVTRHGKPMAALVAAGIDPSLHVGPASRRRGSLKPLLRQATRGRYLEVLREGREDARG